MRAATPCVFREVAGHQRSKAGGVDVVYMSQIQDHFSLPAAGCDMKLINLGKRISEIFRIANLSSLFEHYSDVQIAAGMNQIGRDRDRDA